MRKALVAFFKLQFRYWYAGFFGIVCTVIGSIGEMGTQLLVPSVAWWLVALLSFWLASFLAFQNVYRDWQAYEHPRPDLALEDLVSEHFGITDLGADGAVARLNHCFQDIRQSALLGHIKVWGRQDCMPGHEQSVPLSFIGNPVWKYAHLNLLEYLKDHKGKTEKAVGGIRGIPSYYDIYFNRRQVSIEWPKKTSGILQRWRRKRQSYGDST